MKWTFFLFIAAVLLLTAACTVDNDSVVTGEKPVIVCTTGMIGDAVRNITAGNAEVYTLMGPGTDPHLYKPGKADIDRLQRADIIIANGLHLEGKMQEILQKIGRTKLVIFLGEGISGDGLLFPEEGYNVPDPHIWFDVALWHRGLEYVTEKLAASTFAATVDSTSAGEYFQALEALDSEVRQLILAIPEHRRILVTAHDAFSYYGRRYGLRIESLQGISTLSGYGLKDIQGLTSLIIERQIPAVFVESSIPPRSIQAVIDGCRAKGFMVEKGGTLYSDALGPEGSGAATYIDMVRANTQTIANALK